MLCELVLECKIYLGALASSLDLLTALFVTHNSFWQFVLHVLIDGKKFYLCVGILYNHVLTNWFIENQFAWQFILARLFSYFSFHLFSCVYSLCHSHHFLIHLDQLYLCIWFLYLDYFTTILITYDRFWQFVLYKHIYHLNHILHRTFSIFNVLTNTLWAFSSFWQLVLISFILKRDLNLSFGGSEEVRVARLH